MIRERFLFYKNAGINSVGDEVEHIEMLANKLLEALYYPSGDDRQFAVDSNRVSQYCPGANSEPINWGDLSATVVQDGDLFIVTIEEAAEDSCQSLCEYVSTYLTAWGWNVEVNTEW